MLQREAQASKPEERFVELFQDVFGPAAAAKLESQVYFKDILGRDRYIDFGLDSLLDRYAIEIDGETYHHPAALTSEDYEDQLLRQNSLTHLGWRVLRWTDRQLAEKPEDVKEHLAILLDQAVRLTVPQEYLPCKRGSFIPLHDHQEEALESLKHIRAQGEQIALLSHAVGTGKTTTAIEDARSLGLRTLFLAHTQELVEQAFNRFAELWPEASVVRLGDKEDTTAQVVVGTVQYMSGNLAQYVPTQFGYIVIDEAHHATAKSYRAVLRYFDPQFLLGLTGTPDRADGQSALEVFQQTAHRMDIETAVKSGILCDVRCFRVETNVDLRRLRFNGSLYSQKDLEERVSIPERNRLIVETYAENVPARPAVTFCVSVVHAEQMAKLFQEAGFSARAVSGRLNKEIRHEILTQYEQGNIHILCACDLLNEGWDSPRTEVLLMARPTLSKVIYQQQIGRGMRTYPGKKCLILFDFVDVFSRHNQAMNIHRLTKKPNYRPGDNIFTPNSVEDLIDIPLHLWIRDYVNVDVFDWQEKVEGMVTASALSRILRKTDEWVFDKYRIGEIIADEIVELGDERTIPYFLLEQIPDLRKQFGLKEITDANLFDDFLRFVKDMDMAYSYKPVWFLALLRHADEAGKAPVAQVTSTFQQFYLARQDAGKVVEKSSSSMADPAHCTIANVQQTINRGPFHRFSRLDFVGYASDRAYYQVNKNIWKMLREPGKRQMVESLCSTSLENYYQRSDVSTGSAHFVEENQDICT